MSLDPDAVARWKAETREPSAQRIRLWWKAEDNGLTDEERAELAKIDAFLGERFRQFLQEVLCS